ncbi:ribosome maturation factor RimP [Spirochaetia bacterium]|nr:ribosome maturation factor RimP [Spirochaetia bacterium]
MRYTKRAADPLYDSLEPVVKGLGMSLIELSVSKHKGSVQIRIFVDGGGAAVGIDDCSRVHRALLPRLELNFGQQDLYVEVSSPGIERLIKDGSEFEYYLGRGVRCYRTDISDWTSGILSSADENMVVLKEKDGKMTSLPYELIAKAKLYSGVEGLGKEAAL